MLCCKPLDCGFHVFDFGRTHLAVDRRTVIAAVARRCPIVEIEHDRSAPCQMHVEEVFSGVARPLVVGILEVAGAVEKEHGSTTGLHIFWRQVQLGPQLTAMRGGNRHDLGAGHVEIQISLAS